RRPTIASLVLVIAAATSPQPHRHGDGAACGNCKPPCKQAEKR
ncbi:MAG: hypothetical protein ACI85K_002994, partial [Hyphomicrobiaceae bacterium]